MRKVIILGAGQAGFTAARTVRQNSPDTEITIFEEETGGLYARIRLPEFVAGTLPEEKLFLTPESAFRDMGLTTHFGVTVERVDRANKQVIVPGTGTFPYDVLIFATGARAYIPPVKGLETVESLSLRTLADARRIVEKAGQARDALVIGGGLLGLEAAWALCCRGLKVSVAEFMDRLLPKQLEKEQSSALLEKLDGTGFDFHLGVSLEEVSPADGRIRAKFSDGSVQECGLLLFSAGIRSRTELASACGLNVRHGIVVDNRLCTSDPAIYAIGDCAEVEGKTPGLWLAAKDQGTAVGQILAGTLERFTPPVYSPSLKIGGIQLKELCCRKASEAKT